MVYKSFKSYRRQSDMLINNFKHNITKFKDYKIILPEPVFANRGLKSVNLTFREWEVGQGHYQRTDNAMSWQL